MSRQRKIAALYDIHGNLPALEAVLDEIHRARVDEIVVGGDVLPGPMPRETLATLRAIDIPVRYIYGNGEVAVLDEIAGRPPRVPAQFRETIRWNAQQLDVGQQQFIASWPMTARLEHPAAGQVLFCHATPQNENDILLATTPENVLRPLFESAAAALVVCGHTHMPFDRMVGGTRVVNAGSVGMPFGEPGACWLLIDGGVQLRRTLYDFSAAAERIRRTGYSQAAEFAEKSILHPPSAAEMAALFSRMEVNAS